MNINTPAFRIIPKPPEPQSLAVIEQARIAVQQGSYSPIMAAVHLDQRTEYRPVQLMSLVAQTAPPAAATTATAAARISQTERRPDSAPPRLNTQAGLRAEENNDGSSQLVFEIEDEA
jgi:hypothetical protein